jgi:DNA-binding transcriptional ArsR family regulator
MQKLEHPAVQTPAAVFAALGDPTRLALLGALGGGRERSISGVVGEARSATGILASRQALTKHLAVLERAGLVSCRKVGRETRFRARPEAVDHARAYLDHVARQWDDALGRLKSLVEQS